MTTPGSAHREPLPPSRIAAQWFSILGPPLTAFTQQQLAYSMVDTACRRGSLLPLHLVALLGLGLIALAVVFSRRERELGGPNAGFFSFLGYLMSGIAAALVLVQWLPILFVDPCSH